ATDVERAELSSALRTDPQVADALARAARTEARLEEVFAEGRQTQRVEKLLRDSGKTPVRGQRRSRALRWAAAAALLTAAGLGVFFFRPGAEVAAYPVVSGRVLVDGKESRQIRVGDRLEVVGDAAAVVRLATDGSLAELSPASQGVLRGRNRLGQVV